MLKRLHLPQNEPQGSLERLFLKSDTYNLHYVVFSTAFTLVLVLSVTYHPNKVDNDHLKRQRLHACIKSHWSTGFSTLSVIKRESLGV